LRVVVRVRPAAAVLAERTEDEDDASDAADDDEAPPRDARVRPVRAVLLSAAVPRCRVVRSAEAAPASAVRALLASLPSVPLAWRLAAATRLVHDADKVGSLERPDVLPPVADMFSLSESRASIMREVELLAMAVAQPRSRVRPMPPRPQTGRNSSALPLAFAILLWRFA